MSFRFVRRSDAVEIRPDRGCVPPQRNQPQRRRCVIGLASLERHAAAGSARAEHSRGPGRLRLAALISRVSVDDLYRRIYHTPAMIGTAINALGILAGGIAGSLRTQPLSVAQESFWKVTLGIFT